MKKSTVAIVFLAGLLVGLWVARSNDAVLAQAQALWECKTWTLGADIDAGNTLGVFLRNAGNVELTTAGLSSGSQYALVACKR